MAFLGIDDPLLLWATMLVAALVAGGLTWLLLRGVSKLTSRSEGDFDDKLAAALHAPLSGLVGLVAAGVVFTGATAGRLGNTADLWTQRTLLAAGVIVAAWVLMGVLRLVLQSTGRRHQRLRPATRVARRILAVAIYAGAFLMVLQTYGIRITPLLTGLGIAGLAAALALQDTLGNFFAGISIQTGQAMQPGHFVRLEEKKLDGYVEQVGWRTTHIRTLAGNTIVIPNSTMAQAIVTDYYLPSPDMSLGLEFLVGHETDPKRVMDIVLEEAKAAMEGNDKFHPGSTPAASLSGIEEYALKVTLSVRVKEFVAQYAVAHELRTRVLARFRKEGIRIPYPTQHHYTEKVVPEAKRVPGAPGGFTPSKRPPRPKRSQPEPRDPREAEAEKARQEIAAKVRHEQAKKA